MKIISVFSKGYIRTGINQESSQKRCNFKLNLFLDSYNNQMKTSQTEIQNS